MKIVASILVFLLLVPALAQTNTSTFEKYPSFFPECSDVPN